MGWLEAVDLLTGAGEITPGRSRRDAILIELRWMEFERFLKNTIIVFWELSKLVIIAFNLGLLRVLQLSFFLNMLLLASPLSICLSMQRNVLTYFVPI